MSARFAKFTLFMFSCALAIPVVSFGQVIGGGNGTGIITTGVVGGVKIDASGVLTSQTEVLPPAVKAQIQAGLQQADANIAKASDLRMISLRGLEAAITRAKDEGTPISSEINYLAGLQRIEFVIVSPETNDIILAGPGEGFKLNDQGVVVGENSGTPVIHLEDFLVAMRAVESARTGQGISVSIDPTEKGVQQLTQFYSQLKNSRTPFHPAMQPKVEQAMGEQMIKLTGVPADSRFAQVLVAADYKMKRLAMGLEPAPISNFPSFMEMAQKAKVKNMTTAPRFWMECNYDSIGKSADGNVWQIRGKGVKALTQESMFDKEGKRSIGEKQNRFAMKWADLMTDRFEELSKAEPAFRELRNMMDLSIVAAVITREKMSEKVGLETPAILGLTDAAVTPSRAVAKVVPAQCSFVRIANSWLVSASGGIQLDSWGVAQNSEVVADVAKVAAVALKKTGDSWWWNSAQN